jgi:phospholipase A1
MIENMNTRFLCILFFHSVFAGILCFAIAFSAYAENELSNTSTQASIPLLAAQSTSDERTYLTKVWNLDDQTNWDSSQLNRIQPYRQSYFIANTTSSPNRLPLSPATNHSSLIPLDIDAQEAKFQFSLKADLGTQRHFDFIGIKTLRLWVAYTQQSNWQTFNFRNSSPFRETIYEPELIATLGTGNASGFKLINIGGVHQSNGRSIPESRSWNRIYMQGGWERNDTTSIFLRRWQRIKETSSHDDNPDIIDYMGLGDLVIRWEPKDESQSVAVLLRNNLNTIENRGYIQIDWATPINLGHVARLHLQMTSGHGESLSDYNHYQNTFGIGASFREW